MAYDLRRIVPEWSVSLPTYWGVLIQWGGGHIWVSWWSPPLPARYRMSWVSLSLSGRMLPASEKALVRHGATPQQFMVALWKAVLCMSRAAHPPQLRDTGDWVQPGHTSVAYDTLYPARNFPVAGNWMLQPPESSTVPLALHLHLWHYLADMSVYVPQRHIAQHGEGDMLYWFHLRPRLLERAQWPAFVQRRPAACYVIDLPTAEAVRDLQHCHRWFVL